MLDIANGFLRIPLGLVVALSTILLPHFSRIVTYAPSRLSFYLLEASKLVLWVALSAMIVMSFFAERIFYTIFYSSSFSLEQVAQGSLTLRACMLGLFFHAINKVLLSMFYSLHQVWIPAGVTMCAMLMNIMLCKWWVTTFQITGLAIATSLSAMFQAALFVLLLRFKFGFKLYPLAFTDFLSRFALQLGMVFGVGYVVYSALFFGITLLPAWLAHLLTATVFFWVWVVPLLLAVAYALYATREMFGIHLHFLASKKSL